MFGFQSSCAAVRAGRPSVGGRRTNGASPSATGLLVATLARLGYIVPRLVTWRQLRPNQSQQSKPSLALLLARAQRPQVRPNPSLERTSTGKALGPRNALVYAALRGPSAFPAGSAQLKR